MTRIERAIYLTKSIAAKAIKVRNPKKLKRAVKRTLVMILSIFSAIFYDPPRLVNLFTISPIPASLKKVKEFVESKLLLARKASVI